MIALSALRGMTGRAALLLCIAWPAAGAALSPRQQAEDFEAMWRAIDSGYAYFDTGRGRWKEARARWKPRAERAATRGDFIAALEGALAELRDDHASLSEASPAAPRRIPFETDIWARWRDGAAIIEAVRPFGDADVAGLHPGQVVTRVDGVPVERMVRDRLGAASATAGARDWALVHALAGPRTGVMRLEVREGGRAATLEIERGAPFPAGAAPVIGRRMGDEREIGYLRVRVGARDERLVERFDGALHHLLGTRALILDLRESPGPGSREVTRALLSRFVESEKPWQLREPRNARRIADTIAPRGEIYRAPLVVLVDRWTAGEAEALAAGLAAAVGARLVGTPTAGLRGELMEVKLPHSGIAVSFPAERTFLPSGEPRERLHPAVPVDLAAPSGGPGDPVLYQALKLLEPCSGSACRSAPGSRPPARGSPRR